MNDPETVQTLWSEELEELIERVLSGEGAAEDSGTVRQRIANELTWLTAGSCSDQKRPLSSARRPTGTSSAMPASGSTSLRRPIWPSSRRPGPTQAHWSLEIVRTFTSGVSA